MELWERFTIRARRAVLLAHTEATCAYAPAIGADHLLAGVLRLGEGSAVEVLQQLGTDIDRLQADLHQGMERSQEAPESQEIAFTPEAQRALQLGYVESKDAGTPCVGTEHLLLGLLRLGEGPTYELLTKHGASLDQARHVVLRRGRPGADSSRDAGAGGAGDRT